MDLQTKKSSFIQFCTPLLLKEYTVKIRESKVKKNDRKSNRKCIEYHAHRMFNDTLVSVKANLTKPPGHFTIKQWLPK